MRFPLSGALGFSAFLFAVTAGTTFANAPEFEPCTISGTGGSGILYAECATWSRPLDPSAPDGEQIELFVTRLSSTALEPASDAFTMINGGPGGSSVEMLVDFRAVATAITRERDVIVIDQRGTGKSAPMTCDALSDSVDSLTETQTVELTRDCINKLPHDPRFFSTSVAVKDLEALRTSLGYEQLSLYGVSYGTRVAMHYMRRYPQAVRSMIIDGVVPPSIVLGSNVALNSQQTLSSLFARCIEDSACSTAFPNLASDFARLSERLKRQPISLQLPHPVTATQTELELSYGHLAVLLRMSLYAPETASILPIILNQAATQQQYLPIAANALQLIHQLTSSLNYGMHNAVVCTEDAPFFKDEIVDWNILDETYLGSEMYKTLISMCSAWPAGVIDEDFKQPLHSDAPILILSGEFDPITPPQYGDQVLANFSNAKHIVAQGQGHGVIIRGCIPKVLLDFVESGTFADLDTSCTEHLSDSPFFLDALGPPP